MEPDAGCVTDPNVLRQQEIRQRILEDYGVLEEGPSPDEGLDTAVQLAAMVCECKTAFISWVDWKARLIHLRHRVGIDWEAAPITPTESFCDTSVMRCEDVYIPDASKHPVYSKSRYVTGPPYISFYYSVGLVLDAERGVPVGVLCVMDDKPRELDTRQMQMMSLISKDIVRQVQLRRTLTRSQSHITQLFEQNQALEIVLSNKELNASPDVVQVQKQVNSQFVAALGHELRTPTNIIQCSALLLQSTAKDTEQLEYVRYIQEGVRQLQNVLDKSVEHFDTTSQLMSNNVVQFDIQTLLQTLITQLCDSSDIGRREVVGPSVASTVPQLLLGDEAKISHILGHLLENAVKFTDSKNGKVEISASIREESVLKRTADSHNNVVMVDISVHDNGVGMSSDTHSMLFKSILQGDRTTTRKHGGMGFGLLISYNLATIINGTISVVTKQAGKPTIGEKGAFADLLEAEDHGSIFTLTLPLQIPSSAANLSPVHSPRGLVSSLHTYSSHPQQQSDPESHPHTEPDPFVLHTNSLSYVPELSPPSSGDFNSIFSCRSPTPTNSTSSSSSSTSAAGSPRSLLASPTLSFSSSNLLQSTNAPLNLPTLTQEKDKQTKILVVEDNELNMKVVKRLLEKMGYVPDFAYNGAQAVEKFSEYPNYGLILMDLHMPVMDGITATKIILDLAAGLDKQTKVVAVTSSVSLEVRQNCLSSGMVGMIPKPISLKSLLNFLPVQPS